ncbi:MAG TPA: LuxR C-terminal-related transcriptional regulator [Candidatus Acidoferrales bacterium]|nr:LuxR C-terminal-related transcriptional regulator [Candidatus Acidoferrales bacterium]
MIQPGAFVGRDEQMADLAARRKAAARGRGCIVLVSGEPGCGKTRLLEEFAATLTHGRARVVWIRAPEFGRAQADGLSLVLDDRPRRFTIAFIEDAHDAPPELLKFVVKLGARASRSRLMTVVTYRRPELERRPGALLALAKAARAPGAGAIDLTPLDRERSIALIRALSGGNASLPSRAVDELECRCGGNPLLIAELVRHELSRTPHSPGSFALPLSVRGFVEERLAPLSEKERAALAVAALMPAGFSTADVVAIGDCDREFAVSALRRARSLDLIAECRGRRGSYAFRHNVVAEILASEFLADELQTMHARIACAIETSGASEARAQELAEHWKAAGNLDLASAYAEKAGDALFAAANYAAAAGWYERAEQARKVLGSGSHVYEKLAKSLDRSGNPLGAHAALTAAATALETAGEPERAVRLKIYDAVLAQNQSNLRAGEARLDSAVRFGLPETSERYAQAVAAFFLALRQEPERALELIADFPYDDPATEPAARAKYWEVVAFAATIRCDRSTFERAGAKCLELARRSGDPAAVATAETDLAIAAVHFPGDACDALLERAIALSQEHGLLGVEAYTRAFAALNDLVRGRLASSRDHLNAAALLTGMPMVVLARTFAGLTTGRALCDSDLIAGCAREDLLEAAFGTGIASVFARVAGPYAQWLADAERFDESRRVLHRCVCGLRDSYAAFLTMPVVATHADAEDVLHARELLVAATRNPDDAIAAATLSYFDALWEERNGNRGAARTAAASAARRYARLGWSGLQAYALELAGDRTEALRLYRRCGNLREIRRLELSEAREGADPRAEGAMLSNRERSIAALIAQGKSNQAIASALSVSEKTVERHLTSIFGKLGFRSRTELAASTVAQTLART